MAEVWSEISVKFPPANGVLIRSLQGLDEELISEEGLGVDSDNMSLL